MLQSLKSTRSEKALEAAELLYDIVEQRKELEKKEKLLKAYFKDQIPHGGSVRCGPFQVTVTKKIRRTLDRALLVERLGETAVRALEKASDYFEVGVVRSKPRKVEPLPH